GAHGVGRRGSGVVLVRGAGGSGRRVAGRARGPRGTHRSGGRAGGAHRPGRSSGAHGARGAGRAAGAGRARAAGGLGHDGAGGGEREDRESRQDLPFHVSSPQWWFSIHVAEKTFRQGPSPPPVPLSLLQLRCQSGRRGGREPQPCGFWNRPGSIGGLTCTSVSLRSMNGVPCCEELYLKGTLTPETSR